MTIRLVIQILLGILLVYFAVIWLRDLVKNRDKIHDGNFFLAGGIGFVTNFFDTLGIGSYAPTTMLLKLTKYLKSDKLLPGTLTIACSIPVLVEAFLFITSVKLDGVTLISMIVASMVGSFLGSKFISRFDEKKIQIVMGFALVITAVLMLLQNTGYLASLGNGNKATALTGVKFAIGVTGNFVLGALMTAGIGLYALRAYQLQDQGLDTVEANQKLGFAPDLRNYGFAAAVLHSQKISRIKLMTNNPDKVNQLTSFGIQVVKRVPIEAPVTDENRSYLKTKQVKFHHIISEVN